VKQIDVFKVINKENMLLPHTSAQNFEVGQLVVVVLEKFFYHRAVKISSTARAFDIIYFHEFLNPWLQGCISCGPCSYPELTEDHVLPSA